MVRGHLRLHQLVAADLSGGELLADPGLLVIRQPADHRAGGDEDGRHMAEGRGGHDKARHDLVADAKVKRRVETVVAKRDACGQRDHVAGEKRQFHPVAPLRDAVAHRRDAARDLRGDAKLPRRLADDLRIILIGLVGRQHVVIGGDHADIGDPSRGQVALVRAHRGIGMGLIAAGQVGARRAFPGGLPHPVKIGAPCPGGAGADARGDRVELRMDGHLCLLICPAPGVGARRGHCSGRGVA